MSIGIEDLTVEIDGRPIVSEVSLDIADAERVAVMGPSGAGKTTLLRSVAGLVAPTTGRIVLDGADHTATPPHERPAGLMFQDYALFPHLTVAGNVAYGLRMQGMPANDRDARVAEMLRLVGLAEHADRRIDGLSGGEQQRVALARTLAPRPSVILFDEPLGSLDQGLRDGLLAEMRSVVADLGISAIYVTHDRVEAEAFADRIAIMRSGRLLRVDTPERLWLDPRTEFVARFMGHRGIIDGRHVGHTGPVVVIEHAVRLDPEGPVAGTVASSEFRDGRHRVALDVGASTIWLWSDAAAHVGEQRRISIEPGGIAPLVDEVGGADHAAELVVERE